MFTCEMGIRGFAKCHSLGRNPISAHAGCPALYPTIRRLSGNLSETNQVIKAWWRGFSRWNVNNTPVRSGSEMSINGSAGAQERVLPHKKGTLNS